MAEIVCKSVQLWFPSTEISGGQSAGEVEGLEAGVERVEKDDDDEAVEGGVAPFWDLVMAAQLANEVQERHLCSKRF